MKQCDILEIVNLRAEKSTFRIRWQLTNLCNYQCAFCIQGNPQMHAEYAKGENADTRRQIVLALVKLFEELEGYEQIIVQLIGGEVTVLPDLPEILEALAGSRFKGNIHFQMHTNFSKPAEYYCDLCDVVRRYDSAENQRSIHISASFYSAYTSNADFSAKLRKVSNHMRISNYAQLLKRKQAGNRDDVTDKRLSLLKKPCLSIDAGYPLLKEEDIGSYKSMKSEFARTGTPVNPIFISKYRVDIDKSTLSELIRQASNGKQGIQVLDSDGNVRQYYDLHSFGQSLEDRDGFCPKNFLCDAGIYNVTIDSSGNAMRCAMQKKGKGIGSLLDGSWQRHAKPQLCMEERCYCANFSVVRRAEKT